MHSDESFWIVPSEPQAAQPNRAEGPYATEAEASDAGSKFTFAFNILKTDSEDGLTVVRYEKVKWHEQVDKATKAAHDTARGERWPSGP